MYLHHVSLVSGRTCVHRLDMLETGLLADFQKLLPDGGPLPGLPGYGIKCRGEMITILRGPVPVILCAAGKGRTHAWTVLEVFRETFGVNKVKPPEGQWVATVELPALGPLPMRQVFRLIDCERYLAGCLLSAASANDSFLGSNQ